MKLLSLFSGIGAFEKAFDNLDIPYELVAYCEIDKYASKSYAAIHGVSEEMNLGDITKVDEKALPKDIDLITYGFPCQDISLAGKQKGLFNEDGTQTRSGLFFEALRIIEETQPRVAIAENVKNLTSKKFSEQFKIVLDSLEQAGYNNYWQVLNAKDYGIPQNRERVFIVSIRKDIDTESFKFPEGFPLELRLKDMLENVVDEKYFVNTDRADGLIKTIDSTKVNKNPEGVDVVGDLWADNGHGSMAGRVYNTQGICPTLGASHFQQVKYILDDSERVIKCGNVNPSGKGMNGTVIDSEGLARTITQEKGEGQKILVREATKKGYAEAYEGDSINLEHPNSKTRRGRVGHGVAQTLTTSCNQAVVVAAAMRGRYAEDGKVEQNIEVSDREYANAITTVQKDSMVAVPINTMPDGTCRTLKNQYYKTSAANFERTSTFGATGVQQGSRIRKLTPRENFRLQGFADSDFEKAEAVNSNTQLYKQAGNSICVPVVEYIIKALIDCGALETKNERGKEMELKIYNPTEDGFIKTIEWNHEEIKKEVSDKVAYYKSLVYTDDQIQDAKADRATLNKFIKVLEDKRKNIKKQCLAPYESFEKQMKEIIAIVNEPVALIDSQVKGYEEKKKQEKMNQVTSAWCGLTKPEGLTLEKIFDPRWLNASYSINKATDEMIAQIDKFKAEMDVLADLPEYGFEAQQLYISTLDIKQALNEAHRLAEVAKKKAEHEAEQARLKADQDAAMERMLDEEEMARYMPTPEEEQTPVQMDILDSEDSEPCENFIPTFAKEPEKEWAVVRVKLNADDKAELEQYLTTNNLEFKFM